MKRIIERKKSFTLADELMELARKRAIEIDQTKTEILEAFIAKYGFDPDHAVLLEGKTENGGRSWHVVHLPKHQMERARDIYLISMVSRKPLTRWQRFCIWLAGVKSGGNE